MSQGLEDVTAADDPCGTEQPTVVVARTGRAVALDGFRAPVRTGRDGPIKR